MSRNTPETNYLLLLYKETEGDLEQYLDSEGLGKSLGLSSRQLSTTIANLARLNAIKKKESETPSDTRHHRSKSMARNRLKSPLVALTPSGLALAQKIQENS